MDAPRYTIVRLALPATVLALAVAFGPRALAAPATIQTDRSVKLTLIEKLKTGPEILVLGDSRGLQAEPSYLQKLTGHTGFNAAVTGGSAPDAWVFTRQTTDRFPRQKRRFIWFVSAGLTTDIVDPRLRADPRGRRYLAEVAPYLSAQKITVSWHTRTHFLADGSIQHGPLATSAAQARRVRAAAEAQAASIRRNPPVAPQADPARYRLFEQVITYMNAHGARPVIVLNPVYPTVLTELENHGMPLWNASLTYLHDLRSRLDFVVVDCRDIHVWKGSAADFVNPTHVDWRNMRRMLTYVVAHSDGALR